MRCLSIRNSTNFNILIKPRRNLYQYLNIIFNRPDKSRIKEVGIDRACAEWLMKNGAFVRWVGNEDFVGHYNDLPLNDPPEVKYFIEEVKAVEASIDRHGFPHFQGCKFIKGMKISKCWYVDDKCLEYLTYLKESLISLEISRCAEITDNGLKTLSSLKNLQSLQIGHLPGVRNINECLSFIKIELPNCKLKEIINS